MLVSSFLSWWYGPGWKKVATGLSRRIEAVMEEFSVVQLLRTLFSPWRRIVTYPGAGIIERWKAWNDNLFSRLIGFVVRLFVLFVAVLAMLSVTVVSIVEMVVWPLMPPAVIGCLVWGFIS